ncbi:Serine/threonine-protein phosphatase 2A activator 2 [Candida viswanathii]|uniref:Serine/threonine-protein phosphatase 2A activator n=1 Tax=Candida viswanathii TaxID=5486 RepID=A0A367XNR6_9ASCO|nr:Serine/threonine-protein phosphatase 2A activator 2 [Candida viswanathii]
MTFIQPERRISSQADLDKWIDSPTYDLLLNFIVELQTSVIGKPNDTPVDESPVISQLTHALSQVNDLIDAHPAHDTTSRFGKIEFRDFYKDVADKSRDIISEITTTGLVETATYFTESWGNSTRIDYGSGHELNFIAFLLCLKQEGVLVSSDYPALVLKVFTKYMEIMRHLQKTYWLEPAGSHGVWGLDDYHFLPFLFGAAQLATHPHMKPKSIHNDELVEMYHKKYMYLECIYFINNIKTIPNHQGKLSLRWHLPMLDDISSAKNWDKIRVGMVKMYKVEVLGKLPIMQHFMFGSLIKCPDGIEKHEHTEGENDEHCGHNHANTWGDCCGIKVPSGIAASESLRKTQIPFD